MALEDDMTSDKKRKRAIREKSAKTGLSYAATAQAGTKVHESWPKALVELIRRTLGEVPAFEKPIEAQLAEELLDGISFLTRSNEKTAKLATFELGEEYRAKIAGEPLNQDILDQLELASKDPDYTVVSEFEKTAGGDSKVSLLVGRNDLVWVVGETTSRPENRLYRGNTQIGLVQRALFEANSSHTMGRVEFDFPLLEPSPIKDKVDEVGRSIQESVPWAQVRFVPLETASPRPRPAPPFPPKVKTVEDLARQLERDLSGEKDEHDLAVEAATRKATERFRKPTSNKPKIADKREALVALLTKALDNCIAVQEDHDELGQLVEMTQLKVELCFQGPREGGKSPLTIQSAPIVDLRESVEKVMADTYAREIPSR